MDDDTDLGSDSADGKPTNGAVDGKELPEELKNKHNRKIIAYGHYIGGLTPVKSQEAFKSVGVSIHIRGLRRWYAEFKQGKVQFTHKPKSGRPAMAGFEDGVERIKAAIEAEPFISCPRLAQVVNLNKSRVRQLTREVLKLERYKELWIPLDLSVPEKNARVKRFENLRPPKVKMTRRRRKDTQPEPSVSEPFTFN